MLFKNQQKAVSNTTASNKGQELFGNWELSDELDDADLSAVVGGLGVQLGVHVTVLGGDADVEIETPL